ncbi:hypothetical protein ACFFRE_01480 [Aciditerrimonas ferrireducens]|uniref:SMP-30/Gluconolactonase/LRE-like region domain-containing protein n=1 Tax=Aciditerrimonas ferrireducens TaxID=667306 RepID=A0ABV6BZH1_9ACTN
MIASGAEDRAGSARRPDSDIVVEWSWLDGWWAVVLPMWPAGLAIGLDGTVLLSDARSKTLWRISGQEAQTKPQRARAEAVVLAGRPMLSPKGIAVDDRGTVFVADSSGHRVWTITPQGSLELLAGGISGCEDGQGRGARFRFPTGVAIGPDRTCYVADTGNDRIRLVRPDGRVETVAGSIYDWGDGEGALARFRRPESLIVDAEGVCYVADTGNNAIRRLDPDGGVTTIAGSPLGGEADGLGSEAGFRWPMGITIGDNAHLWVADHGNGSIRQVESTGRCTTALRCSGRRRPVAVARAPGGSVIAAIAVLDRVRGPETFLVHLQRREVAEAEEEHGIPGR